MDTSGYLLGILFAPINADVIGMISLFEVRRKTKAQTSVGFEVKAAAGVVATAIIDAS